MQGAATCLFARWLDEVDVKVVMGRDLLDSAYNTGTQRELKQEMASSDGGGVTGSLSWLRAAPRWTSRSTLPSTRSSIRRWPRIWASPSSTGITSKVQGRGVEGRCLEAQRRCRRRLKARGESLIAPSAKCSLDLLSTACFCMTCAVQIMASRAIACSFALQTRALVV